MIDKLPDTFSLQYLNSCVFCFSNSRLDKDQEKLNNKNWKDAAHTVKKIRKKKLIPEITAENFLQSPYLKKENPLYHHL